MVAGIKVEEEIIRDLERLDIKLYIRGQHGYWASLRIEPDLISRIKEAQKEDSKIWTIVENLDKQVKIEHQRASGLLQQLDIPVWKWDEISMDFVTGLPQTQRRHDAIWVVVDRLTKSIHFLPIRKDYSVSNLAEIFQQEIVRLHGTLQRLYQTETHVSRLVFGKVCRKLGEPGLSSVRLFIPRQTVKEKLKEARTRQKSYADKHRRELEFQPGDHVFLKVSPAHGVRRFGIKGKLSPR
nr:hypothetical protein [Tanacetum cinerariifolium]